MEKKGYNWCSFWQPVYTSAADSDAVIPLKSIKKVQKVLTVSSNTQH